MIPVAEDDSAITVAFTDPSDHYGIEALELALGKPVRPIVGVGSEIREGPETPQGRRAGDHVRRRLPRTPPTATTVIDDIEHLRDMASEAPVIRMVNHLIVRALEMRASDIHIEPFEGTLTVRFRVDGVLREMGTPGGLTAAVISRVKVMANLNIAERRLPQDGRIKVRVERARWTCVSPPSPPCTARAW